MSDTSDGATQADREADGSFVIADAGLAGDAIAALHAAAFGDDADEAWSDDDLAFEERHDVDISPLVERKVRTAAGAKKYGKPIGATITRADILRVRRQAHARRQGSGGSRGTGGGSGAGHGRNGGQDDSPDGRSSGADRDVDDAPPSDRQKTTRPPAKKKASADRAAQIRTVVGVTAGVVALGLMARNFKSAAGSEAARKAGEAAYAATKEALEADFPNASPSDIHAVASAAMVDAVRAGSKNAALSPAGRGPEVMRAALARKEAFKASGQSLDDVLGAARSRVGDPSTFGLTDTGHLDVLGDGGPSPETLKRLNAVRDAGAAIDAEIDLRLGKNQAKIDELAAKWRTAREMANENAAKFESDLAKDWQAEFGEPMPDQLGAAFRYKPDTVLAQAKNWPDAEREFLESRREQAMKVAEERAQVSKIGDGLRVATDRDKIAREILAEHRAMGPGADGGPPVKFGDGIAGDAAKQAEVEKLLGDAQQKVPTDWLNGAKANQKDPLSLVYEEQRASYHPGLNQIDIGDYSSELSQEDAILHEFTHSMETSNRQLRTAQWAFLKDRTTRGGVPGKRKFDDAAQIYQGSSEAGYLDDFEQHYMGKTYGMDDEKGFELLTMGMEGVMGHGTESMPDPDMRHFILGTLATL